MAVKRWITGEEILERWQAAPFELVEAILSGGLVAVNIKTGIKFSEDTIPSWGHGNTDRCFFCTKPIEWLTVCYSVRQALHPDKYNNIFCNALRPGLTEDIRTEERIKKAMELHFLFSEVESYEKAHELGSVPRVSVNTDRIKCVGANGWIKGEEILHRWDALPFEIFDPMERGELVPIRELDGVRRTKDVDPCLYCEGGIDDGLGWDIRSCQRLEKWDSCGEWQPEKRVQRVLAATFLFDEVLSYEARTIRLHERLKKNGIGPFEQEREGAPLLCLGPGERIESWANQRTEISETDQPECVQPCLQDTMRSQSLDIPDNPLDYGKQLVGKGYQPQERISRMKEAFPWLSTGQIGAYARGIEPGEVSKAANKKWYQDNKPR